MWAGTVANRGFGSSDQVGGAGWTREQAEQAGLGEAIERWQTHRLPSDQVIKSSYEDWSSEETALSPDTWTLFHPEQLETLPFEALTESSVCSWVCCRSLTTGDPVWTPASLTFMDLRPGSAPRFAPGISTGWSAHRDLPTAIERGLAEVIERDALVGACWGRYGVYEWKEDVALAALPESLVARIQRANLRYRWYRVDSPYSQNVTMVTVSGEDQEGYCLSIGSACRNSIEASFDKALLEALQGRHYVRYLLSTEPATEVPTTFAQHAAYYSHHRDKQERWFLAQAADETCESFSPESHRDRVERLASQGHEPLFRIMTPPEFVARDWVVARVIACGLQPLHGDHRMPFLGGPMWGQRSPSQWDTMLPHPFA